MSNTNPELKRQAADLLKFHPLAVKYGGNLGKDELDALAADIKSNGQKFPIIVHYGVIVDGIQRYRACQQAKIKPITIPYDVERYGDSVSDIKAFIISANVVRRHDPKRKRAIIAELLKENPTKSDRAVAKEAKTHHVAVAAVRKEEERRGNIFHAEKRTDSKGRQQPASRPKLALIAAQPEMAAPPSPSGRGVPEVSTPPEKLTTDLPTGLAGAENSNNQAAVVETQAQPHACLCPKCVATRTDTKGRAQPTKKKEPKSEKPHDRTQKTTALIAWLTS